MALKLVVTTNVNGDVFELFLKKSTYKVGRSRDNDLRIKETYVSGYHSELNRNDAGDYALRDCGSSNGTFLNGVKVEEPVVVKAGDFIKFGILKVAVMEHEPTGPKVVSLRDRPAFAKKRDDQTGAIPSDAATGKVDSPEGGADSQPVTGSASPVSDGDLKKVENLLEQEEKKSKELAGKLSKQEETVASLTGELKKLQSDLGEKEEALTKAQEESEGESKQRDDESVRLKELELETAELKTQLEEAEKRSDESLDEQKCQSAELEELRSKLEAAEKELTDAGPANDAAAESASKLEKREAEFSRLEAELEEVKASVGDLAEARSELAELRENFSRAEEERGGLQKQVDEISKKSGHLQAELNQESARASQADEELNSSRKTVGELRGRIEELEKTIDRKDRDFAEKELEFARNESDAIVELKRQLGEAQSAAARAEERADQSVKEKLNLSGSYERLKAQFEEAGLALAAAAKQEEEILHEKGLLSRRLEKAEAGNSELAARIKEDTTAALANQNLIEKLELQLCENESEAVQREQKHAAELKAEISRLQREGHAAAAESEKLQRELEAVSDACRAADENGNRLQQKIIELESEGASTRKLLQETEKHRAELTSQLSDQSSLASDRARVIDEQKADLAGTIAKARASEEALLEKQRSELDALHSEIRRLKEHNAKLEEELENTRIGLSEALRQSRDQSETEKTKLLSEGHTRLSEIEVELSNSIHAREEMEELKNGVEDELNEREERIERLSEQIEDLELKMRDEQETREEILGELQRTKEGLSKALFSTRKHLGVAQKDYEFEMESRRILEEKLEQAQEELQNLRDEAEAGQRRFQSELKDREERYEELRDEKLSIESEDANLKQLRAEVETAMREKEKVEGDLVRLDQEMKTFQSQHESIKTQKDELVRDREELKAGLNAARSELESLQRRNAESEAREAKLAGTIESAEKRIHSLKKLEAEMEQAFERKRQKGVLSRSDVFSETTSDLIASNSEFSKEEFYRKLIAKLDLIDDLSKRYDNRWRYPKVADQLSILKDSFIDFLHDHSVREFQLEPGTVLSIEERKRIKLVPPGKANVARLPEPNGNGNGRSNTSRVIETIRPGYVYRNGSRDVIIRKAEVIVA